MVYFLTKPESSPFSPYFHKRRDRKYGPSAIGHLEKYYRRRGELMTDKQTLLAFRLKQAGEAPTDAERVWIYFSPRKF